MGVSVTHPCHACNVMHIDQCETACGDDNISKLMRNYGDFLFNIIHGCEHQYLNRNLKAAQQLQKETGFSNMCLPLAMWSKFFNPIKQTPPCLMHNGPLGLIQTMILQFAKIHGDTFVNHINIMSSSLSKFPGIPQTLHSIFCGSKKDRHN